MPAYVNLNKITPFLSELNLDGRTLSDINKATEYIRERDGEDVVLEIHTDIEYGGIFFISYETDVFGMVIEISDYEKKIVVSGCDNRNTLTMTTYGTMEYLLECADKMRKIITYEL